MLAVKYRPAKITDLVGQPAVQKIMVGLLRRFKQTGILPNSILLHGAHGSGKTTTARLLARYLNCEKGPTTACGVCASCKAMDRDAHPSVLELDAASHRGIENVRDLQNKLAYQTPYPVKVIILDEAHQLTDAAFNALLKTLEDGVDNTVFILCTTAVDKILETIVSRSLSLQINTIPEAELVNRLGIVAEAEGIQITQQAIENIVSLSRGHCRDALQLMESAWLYANRGEVKAEAVLACSGYSSLKTAKEFTGAFLTENPVKVMELVKATADDPVQLIKTILVVIGLELKARFAGREARWPETTNEKLVELNSLFMHARHHFEQSRYSLFVLMHWFEAWKRGHPMEHLRWL